jgi:hypothetical protein
VRSAHIVVRFRDRVGARPDEAVIYAAVVVLIIGAPGSPGPVRRWPGTGSLTSLMTLGIAVAVTVPYAIAVRHHIIINRTLVYGVMTVVLLITG